MRDPRCLAIFAAQRLVLRFEPLTTTSTTLGLMAPDTVNRKFDDLTHGSSLPATNPLQLVCSDRRHRVPVALSGSLPLS